MRVRVHRQRSRLVFGERRLVRAGRRERRRGEEPAPGLDARGLTLEFSCEGECGDCCEASGERRGVASLLILPGLVIDSL